MPTPKDFVESAIAKHPVVVFSKSYCPYCAKAKRALSAAAKKVQGYDGAYIIELDLRGDGAAIQQYLASKTGRRTVPNVFIAGKSVGGGDETASYAASGVLPQMIAAALYQPRNMSKTSKQVAANGLGVETALFGAGCFWGVELAFQREPGVIRTEVGYANGDREMVDYRTVCTGRSGHAEVVKVWFKPAEVSFQRLIKLWESRHDVTSLNQQGNDIGSQYRSAIFYTTEAQRKAARVWRDDANVQYQGRVVSDIGPVSTYCAAEDVHQQYLQKRGQSAAKGATEHIRCYG